MRGKGLVNNAVLAIDGTHINVTKPLTNGWNYYNRNGQFSITFLCVCDHKKRFNCMAYNYERIHDARVYRNLGLRDRIERISQNYVVLGDPAFVG